MKTKSFLLGAAALMLAASCSNDEVVNVAPQSGAIGFSSFVNNSTRATDKDAFGSGKEPDALRVYGIQTKGNQNDEDYIAPRKLFFDDTEDPDANLVTKGNNGWTYSPLRFWVPGSTYTFAAVAPASALAPVEDNEALVTVTQGTDMTNGGITAISFTNDGETDLLYNAVEIKTPVTVTQDPVSYTLGHLLSRVRFKFVNGMAKQYSIQISDLKIKDAYGSGTYNPVSGAWSVEGVTDKEFKFTEDGSSLTAASSDDVTSDNKYFVAATKSHTAYFKIKLLDSGTEIGEVEHTVAIPSIDFTKGYTYTLTTTITDDNIDPTDPDDPNGPTLKPIKFTVNVDPWENETKPVDFLGE